MKREITRFLSIALMAGFVGAMPVAGNAAGISAKAVRAGETGIPGIHVLPQRQQPAGIVKSVQNASTSPRHKLPAANAAGMPEIYGSVIYSTAMANGTADPGIYNIKQNPELLFAGPEALMGGVLVDETYYTIYYANAGGLISFASYSYDIVSGEQTGEWYPESYDVLAPGGMVYDTTTSTIYGITYNASMNGLQLSKIEFTDNGPVSTLVKALPGNWNSLACDASGQLYGISYTGSRDSQGSFVVDSSYLNKIDKTTGAVTMIGTTGYKPAYLTGAVIDPKSGKMYWNVNESDGSSYMCEVNLSTGAASLLYELTGEDEVMGMYILPEAADDAPAACTDVTYSFPGGALTGEFTLTTPSTLFDGSAPSEGTLGVHVLANGTEVGSAEADWNASVTIPADLSQLGAGMYTFKVYASNAAGDGEMTVLRDIWVGADTPAAPEATLTYSDGKMNVSWAPVEGTVNGGWLDAANLTYSVFRGDGTQAAAGLTGTAFSEEMDDSGAVREVYYIVKAVAGDLISPEGRTNTVTVGSIIPPYTSNFAADGFTGWTVINANADEQTWMIMYDGSAGLRYNSQLGGDDWLITPRVRLETGKAYNVSFEARAYNKNYTETVEVKFGSAPTAEGMASAVIAPTDFTGNSWNTAEGFLTVPEDGYYYIGIHDISDGSKSYYTYLRNLTIVEGASASVPMAPENLTAVPDQNGAFNITVSFNAPSKDLAGVNMSELEKVEVYRFATLVKTFDNPEPGAPLEYIDNLPGGGEVTYTVCAYNSNGRGLDATVSAIVGFDAPAAVSGLKMSRTDVPGQVIVSWNEVTEDIYGKTFGDEAVTYTVKANRDGVMKVVATGLKTLDYTDQAVSGDGQQMVQYAVYAEADGLMSEAAVTDLMPVGTPYDGIEEGFADASTHYVWGYRPIADGTVEFWDDSEDPDIQSINGDNGLIGICSRDFGGVTLVSGLISLESFTNPELSFYTFNLDNSPDDPDWADKNAVIVTLKTVDGAQESGYTTILDSNVNEICKHEMGWGQAVVPLSAYAGKTIVFELSGITRSFIYTIFDDIFVGEKKSGVAGITESDVLVKSGEGKIYISGAEGSRATVYAVNGITVFDGLCSGYETVATVSGAYIVKIGEKTFKLMVK